MLLFTVAWKHSKLDLQSVHVVCGSTKRLLKWMPDFFTTVVSMLEEKQLIAN